MAAIRTKSRSVYPRSVLYVGELARRQLGSDLHQLHPVLPLFDGVTGQAVPQHVDNRVERLRDALMDDARERVDDLGEDLVVGLALASATYLHELVVFCACVH